MANLFESVTKPAIVNGWSWFDSETAASKPATPAPQTPGSKFAPLHPLREWLNNLEVRDAELAHHLCHLIPAQCPFERDIQFFGRTLFHIPPMCKLNPL